MMTVRYEPIANPRFFLEEVDGAEQIRIKARRQIFPMLFIPVWLAGWSAGGVFAFYSLFTDFQPFVVLWLCFWAVGWVFAASTLAWTFSGFETLRVINGDLEIGYSMFGWSRRRLYQGALIRNMTAAGQVFPWGGARLDTPFFRVIQSGAVKFDYGPRTVYAAAALDEAEGRAIIDRLARRLPATARA